MTTIGGYDNALYNEYEPIMAFPADTRRDVDKHAAEARRRIVRKRDALRMEISNRWRQRFKEIKEENDTLERELAQAFKDAQIAIVNITHDKYEGIQR
jgi:chromosome condensin MukBEF MukE localization factor